ncbi:hypothetical protein KKD80_04180 [Patescibacteria group bacterium]|nr:hypothetical protein [Patescibacteria group bacterium]
MKSPSLKIILTIVITTVVIGGGVYLWQQIFYPQAQVRETDNRILLTPQNIEQYNLKPSPGCEEKFNFDTANTNVLYANAAKGISVQIPFNSNWGSGKYRINPYDEHEDGVSFGPISGFEACSWIRNYFLSFKPAKTAEEVIAELPLESNPSKMTVNNLTIIKYTDSGLCPYYPTLVIIGKKYNYALSPLCVVEKVDEEFKFLENIVKTVKLID